MGISLGLENEIEKAVKSIRNKHRIRKSLVIIITEDKLIINPETSVKDPKYTSAYGIGYNDGRNDLHDLIYNKTLDRHINTKENKDYQ